MTRSGPETSYGVPDRVAFVLDQGDALGGVLTATLTLMSELERRGSTTTLIGVHAPAAPTPPWHRTAHLYDDAGIWSALLRWVHRRTGMLAGNRMHRLSPIRRARAARRLRELTRSTDLVVAMNVFAGELVLASGERDPGQVRLLQWPSSFDKLRGSSELPRLRRIHGHFDATLALSRDDATLLRNAGIANAVTIPNPNPLRRAHRPAARALPLVLGIGRYAPPKTYGDLIATWATLDPQIRAGWRLELHGEGPLRSRLEEAAELVPDGSATVHPAIQERTDLYRSASIFVLPSRYEGQPLTLIEAMSQGVACVASDCAPGVRELLSGCGILVDPDDPEALGAALARLMADAPLRAELARTALAASERFDRERVVDEWITLIASAREGARRGGER